MNLMESVIFCDIFMQTDTDQVGVGVPFDKLRERMMTVVELVETTN
jgi:hypothetical protein